MSPPKGRALQGTEEIGAWTSGVHPAWDIQRQRAELLGSQGVLGRGQLGWLALEARASGVDEDWGMDIWDRRPAHLQAEKGLGYDSL